MGRLVLERLTKIFQGREGQSICALNEVTLAIEESEFLAVAGPSGCGKTTLLRLIAGLEVPTSGTIAMDNVVLNGVAPKERDVAMVFQNPALYPHMSAYENMAFGLIVRGCSKPETRRRVTEAAELLGLTGCLAHRPMELSGGERQRVALGRALVRRPKLLLLDEPLSNLDPLLRSELRQEIARIQQTLGATFIYVTHDQVEAMSLGQRVAILNKGALRQVAEPLELYRQPGELFVARFVGSPTMNIFSGRLVQKEANLWFIADVVDQSESSSPMMLPLHSGAGTLCEDCIGKRVYLGLRPEHIIESTSVSETGDGPMMVAAVESVETLGAETHLHLSACGHSFLMRCFGQRERRLERSISVWFDMNRAHFFDASSEKRLDSQKFLKEFQPTEFDG